MEPLENPASDEWALQFEQTKEQLDRLIDVKSTASALGFALMSAIGTYDMLHIQKDPTCGTVFVTGTNSEGKKTKRINVSGENIRHAMNALIGVEVPGKTCAGECREIKPLHKFSKCSRSPDGYNSACLVCERKRVREYKVKVKETGQRVQRKRRSMATTD